MIQKLPKDWEIKELNRVIVDIIDYRGKTPRKLGGNWSESGTIALSAMNVKQGQLVNLEKARFVNDELYNKWMKSEVIKADILMTSEAPLGETYLVPDDRKICLSQRLFCIRADSSVVLPQFLFYFFNSPISRKQIDLRATGTTVLGIRQSDLRETPIIVPPLTTQRKIAAVLSAYDDLIENNTRRIRILEDMAQTLYREWFVHFRFPGHENVPMVESPLGPIPQGWEVKRLDEVAQLYRGRSYRSINLVEDGEGLPFLNLKNINREGGFRSDGLKWYNGEFKETQAAVSNDIIMALTDVTQDRKVVARSARVPDLGYEKYVFSMDLLKVQPKKLIQSDFLYALLKYSSFAQKLKEFANGTTVLHLSPSHVQSSELILPSDVIRHKYAEIAKSVRQQSDLLQNRNANLQQTRDLLLPKLISGEIDVSELDINTNLKHRGK